jgi:hypothetical protein
VEVWDCNQRGFADSHLTTRKEEKKGERKEGRKHMPAGSVLQQTAKLAVLSCGKIPKYSTLEPIKNVCINYGGRNIPFCDNYCSCSTIFAQYILLIL